MKIKVPKTHLLITIGNRAFSIYSSQSITNIKSKVEKANTPQPKMITLEVARTPENKFWYPNSNEKIVWSEMVLKPLAINGMIKMPEPNVRVSYATELS